MGKEGERGERCPGRRRRAPDRNPVRVDDGGREVPPGGRQVHGHSSVLPVGVLSAQGHHEDQDLVLRHDGGGAGQAGRQSP